jgi:NADH-quinone oxidoreductase subunit L
VFAKHSHWLEGFLAPVFEKGNHIHIGGEHSTELIHMAIAVVGALVMAWVAYTYFVKQDNVPVEDGEETSKVHRLVYNKYYVDEIYAALITRPLDWLSDKFYKILELRVVDAAVNGVGSAVKSMAGAFRYLQNGDTGFYIFAMVLCIVLLFFIKLM